MRGEPARRREVLTVARVVVTASYLDDLARTGGPLAVPRDAIVTPGARDWLFDNRRALTWTDQLDASARRFGLAGRLAAPTVRSVREWAERQFGSFEAFELTGAPADDARAVVRLGRAVGRDELAGGVVLTDDAALAALAANKQAGIRAAAVERPEQLDRAVSRLGLNVLVLAIDALTFHQLRGLIERFCTAQRPAAAAVDAVLEEADRARAGEPPPARDNGTGR